MSAESLQGIQEQADAALFNAGRLLEPETGRVNYEAFTPEQLTDLDAGPGRVTRPAEMRAVHMHEALEHDMSDEQDGSWTVTTPSWRLFLMTCNNFRDRFWRGPGYDVHYDHLNLSRPVVQRFRILFPALDDVAVRYVRWRDRQGSKPGHHPSDAHYGPFMQAIYGIMAQLVDQDDLYAGGTVGTSRQPDKYLIQ